MNKVLCYCGKPAIYIPTIYGGMYQCSCFPKCHGRVGAKPNGEPLGTLCDAETRRLRVGAHSRFDRLWQAGGEMTRKEAYKWLQEALRLSKKEAHIAMMDKSQCRELIELLERREPPPFGATKEEAIENLKEQENE